MRRLLILLLSVVLLAAAGPAAATTGRVIKVLPQFLDLQGRNLLSPSLYDRDAYQAQLRKHPEQRSALCFNVQWRARSANPTLKLRVELRGIATGNLPRQAALEMTVNPGGFSRWTRLTLAGDEFKNFGDLTSWRATLWDGDQMVAEQKSFLW